MGIPLETVLDLLRQEKSHYRDRKALEKVVRRKLHNITAPYLEDLNYTEAAGWLEALPQAPSDQAVREVSVRMMESHTSTRERLPFLDVFYTHLFEVTGKPGSILDLACGMHPFGFPWMGLPLDCTYRAYDIHAPRVALINRFFRCIGLETLAEVRDVLVSPPRQEAQLALLFKEAHRMEKRKSGCSREFWKALNVRYLAVSLPSADLSGSHDLSQRHRRLVQQVLVGLPWTVTELAFENELVFVIDKRREIEGNAA